MTKRVLEFWFEFASTYSYPAAMRIEAAAAAAGIEILWRPFLLGPIFFQQQGLKDSVFNVVPAKGAYMWRDLERICAGSGLAFTRPSAFPRNSLKAARVTMAAASEPWAPAFVRAVYSANFALDLDIADAAVLARCVEAAGGDPAAALAAIETEPVKQGLRAATEEAAGKGIFGAPSFIAADGELFWGKDRLDDAIAWAAGRRSL
jgi:2-hydroxychromene-2-carboxylate isomerase